jgi:hypothetical protein
MYAYCGCALLWPIHPLPLLSLTPLPPTPHFSIAFNTYLYILYLHILCHSILLMLVILFSFFSFPEFHRVVPLLQTCSISEFVYDHVCFCVHIYLWIYLLCMRENMCLLAYPCQHLLLLPLIMVILTGVR